MVMAFLQLVGILFLLGTFLQSFQDEMNYVHFADWIQNCTCSSLRIVMVTSASVDQTVGEGGRPTNQPYHQLTNKWRSIKCLMWPCREAQFPARRCWNQGRLKHPEILMVTLQTEFRIPHAALLLVMGMNILGDGTVSEEGRPTDYHIIDID